MWHWLRRRFIAGFFVTVPIVVTIVTIVWLVQWIDGFTSGWPIHRPGFGLLVTASLILVAGVLATNVLGRRLLQRGEQVLLHLPLVRTVYGPVKQLVTAFSPDSEVGFKRVVLIDDPRRGLVLGFLTREFTVEQSGGAEDLMAVYVPTNHLYLGDVVICRSRDVRYPDLSVEEAVRVFLTGGMGLPERLGLDRPRSGPDRVD
jgi:uncharacterized membrane protein